MADDEETTTVDPVTAWGTWEELLLASAVGRHGFHDWDSVALELQARSSLPNLITTARNCELKFRDLKRRFGSVRKDGVVSERENGTDFGDEIDGFPWVDELRKLRVAELRRQVQRSDFSIHSLQLKVKRLEEEGDRSLKENEISIIKADLEENSGEQRSENDNEFSQKSDRSEQERRTLKVLISGEETDRLYHSVNESNSTGTKSGDGKTGEENTQSETKPGLFCSNRSEPLQQDSKPVTADSDNASSDTVTKDPACEPLEPSLEKKVQESSELDDSRARSNGEEEETRASNEVQSSASLAGKRKRKKRQRREITIGGQAPPHAKVSLEQLNEILRIIQAHHHSPSFESRLQSQEMDSEEYKNIVRRHIDLETIRGKLHKGSYALLPLAFYRDLLLLFTNAVIFFPKFSDESIAAGELLQLVSTAMKKTQVVPTPNPSPSDSSPPIPFPSQVPKLERSDSVPIVVCRKRSSIAAKPSSLVTGGNKGEEYPNDEKKSSFDLKLPVKSASTVAEEPRSINENKVREKPVTGARSSRRSNDVVSDVRAPRRVKKRNTSGPKAGSVDKIENPKTDKKNPETTPVDKRRSAADFLKRIKQNTPSETINSGGEQKKGGVKGEKVKERSSRQSTEKKKQANQNNSPSKRSIGRPPKKVAEKSSVSTKRTREVGGGGKESQRRPRKRSKRTALLSSQLPASAPSLPMHRHQPISNL